LLAIRIDIPPLAERFGIGIWPELTFEILDLALRIFERDALDFATSSGLKF